MFHQPRLNPTTTPISYGQDTSTCLPDKASHCNPSGHIQKWVVCKDLEDRLGQQVTPLTSPFAQAKPKVRQTLSLLSVYFHTCSSKKNFQWLATLRNLKLTEDAKWRYLLRLSWFLAALGSSQLLFVHITPIEGHKHLHFTYFGTEITTNAEGGVTTPREIKCFGDLHKDASDEIEATVNASD